MGDKEHPLAGIDSLMDGKDRDFRVERHFNDIPKGDIEVHCACCQISTAPTGNPEDGWFDFVEDGQLKRRLADGTVVNLGQIRRELEAKGHEFEGLPSRCRKCGKVLAVLSGLGPKDWECTE